MGKDFGMKEYPEYNYKEKNVRIEGEKYRAFFPKNHSSVKGVVVETRNLNAGDSYANIANWHTKLFVIKKGNNKWSKIYEGPTNSCERYNLAGYLPLLFSLETKEFRKKWLKEEETQFLKNKLERATGKRCVLETRV